MVMSYFVLQSVSNYDKIRIIALYCMIKNGITEENLRKLFSHAQIGDKDQDMVRNLSLLGVNTISDVSKTFQATFHVKNLPNLMIVIDWMIRDLFVYAQGNRKKTYTVPRKERITENTYQVSRWTPVVKDIVEDSIDDKLDPRHFPFLSGRNQSSTYAHAPTSARYGHWHKDKTQTSIKNVPRVIVFIVGGMTYSEMRCAYEVTAANKNWEIIIGSSQILTPEGFLSDLAALNKED